MYTLLYLFVFLSCFWLCWVSLLHAGFLWLWRVGLLSCWRARPHPGGVSRCRARRGGCSPVASLAEPRSPGHQGFGSCGFGAQSSDSAVGVHRLSCTAACGNLPRRGIEPVSPALTGGFLSTREVLTVSIRYFDLIVFFKNFSLSLPPYINVSSKLK